MSLEKIADEVIESDVLVIGGGIGGCSVAAKARDHNLNVTLLEKSTVERGGNTARGVDHIGPFPRDGVTAVEMAKMGARLLMPWYSFQGLCDENIFYRSYSLAFWALEELEKKGISFKWDDGEYYWMPVAYSSTGPKRIMLRIHKWNIKPELNRMVRKAGVNVLDRTMAVDLLTRNGSVVGATALNIRTGKFIVIKAKATVLATGHIHRCYDPELRLPGKHKMVYHFCPTSTGGDGEGLAYRAGAELANVEFTTWYSISRDDLFMPAGQFPMGDGIPCKCFTANGEEVSAALTKDQYHELERQGKTPIYWTLEHFPDDYQKRLEVAVLDEVPIALKFASDRGFNPRNHWYELGFDRPGGTALLLAGVHVDDSYRTTVPGLYALGDLVAGGGGSLLLTFPAALWLGDNLPAFNKKIDAPIIDEDQVQSQKETAFAPLRVKDGVEPLEFEVAIRDINERYAYAYNLRSEGKLREGLNRLSSLRREWLPKLAARDPHELMSCLDVRNILDFSEVHMSGARERKETKGGDMRMDYPEANPAYEGKALFARRQDGKITFRWAAMPTLKPEYEEGGK